MFRKTKELQSLVDASRKNLKDAERKVEDRNILIADLQKKNEEFKNLDTFTRLSPPKEELDKCNSRFYNKINH